MYVATIDLGFTVDDSEREDPALIYFLNNVWPPTSKEWSAILVYADSPNELIQSLNLEFVQRLRDISPYAEIANWNLHAPFKILGWHRGSNGLHENGPHLVMRDGDPGPQPCTFSYQSGSLATLLVRATFAEIKHELGAP